MLYLFGLPLFVWFLYNFQFVFTPSDARKWILLRMATWMIPISVVIGVQYYYHQVTRQAANDIVAEIEKFRSETGNYPVTLDEII